MVTYETKDEKCFDWNSCSRIGLKTGSAAVRGLLGSGNIDSSSQGSGGDGYVERRAQ